MILLLKSENVLFKHNRSVVSTVIQHSLVYILKSTNGKAAFQVQAYEKSINGLAVRSVTVFSDAR